MASIKFYLDSRRPKCDGSCALKLAVCHNRAVRYVGLGVCLQPEWWDEAAQRAKPKYAQAARLNSLLSRWRAVADGVLLELSARRDMSIGEMQAALKGALFPVDEAAEQVPADLLVPMMERYAAIKRESTRLTYERTITHVKRYDKDWARLRMSDVTRSWLMGLDAHMAKSAPSPNARAIHMRNLRAVFNFAIDDGLTTNYPFRRFRIKQVATDKRSLSIDDLRLLASVEVEEWQRPYRDFFMLSFLLIGINPIDLLMLRPDALRGGRIVYNRSKTARLYSVKVEPEAMCLIERWRGKDHLLCFMDARLDYLQFVRQCNHALKMIGTGSRAGKRGVGQALFPGLTTYWARHSWATIASSLDVPKDVIAVGLGHGAMTVTDVYIDFERKKVDEAHRRVVDWVLHPQG